VVLHKHIRHCGSTVNSVVISQLQLYFLLSVSVTLVSLDGVSGSQPDGWSVNLPCTIKSRSSFLAPAHLGGPGKRAIKRLCVCLCVCVSVILFQLLLQLQLCSSSINCTSNERNVAIL